VLISYGYMRDILQKLHGMFWVLILVVLVNIAQFRLIENENPSNYKAVYKYDTADITTIGMRSLTARTHWLSFITLGKVAPDSHIFISEGSYYDDARYLGRFYAYGKAESVKKVNLANLDILQEIEISSKVVASGEDMLEGRPHFAIAMKDNRSNELSTGPTKGLSIVKNLPAKEGASFLITEWQGPFEPFHISKKRTSAPFYVLFIELALLPDDVQQRINP